MKYVKPLTLFEYAKRLRMSILGIDVGDARSGVCVAYPSTGDIKPARSLEDHSVYSFKHDSGDRAVDIFKLSTSLNELAEHHNAAGFYFGYPYDWRFLADPDLGRVIIRCIWDLNSSMSLDGQLLQRMRLFSVVNENSSSKFGIRHMLVDFFKEKENFTNWTPQLYRAYMQFLTSPANDAEIMLLKKLRLDSFAAVQFTKWYFNRANGTGTGPILVYARPDEWDGDYEASQAFIEGIIKGMGFEAAEDI